MQVRTKRCSGAAERADFGNNVKSRRPLIANVRREDSAGLAGKEFPRGRLLVEDPQTDEALEVLSGKMRFHSKDRDEVYRKAVELRPRRFAVLYTGSISKGAAVGL